MPIEHEFIKHHENEPLIFEKGSNRFNTDGLIISYLNGIKTDKSRNFVDLYRLVSDGAQIKELEYDQEPPKSPLPDLEQARIRQLEEESQRLAARNAYLEGTVQDLTEQLDHAHGDGVRLERRISSLEVEAQTLKGIIELMKAEAQKTATSKSQDQDSRDPKGYCKTLGIDPSLLDLPDDKFDFLLRLVYRGYSAVRHPEQGGSTKAMQELNEAHEFLENPRNRRSYGR